MPVNAPTDSLPDLADLPIRSRALLRAAVANDRLMRTALLSTLTVAFARSLERAKRAGQAGRLRDQLEFYAELATTGDPRAVFHPPEPHDVRIAARRVRPPKGGRADALEFDSSYVALNPMVRAEYARHAANATAHVLHWRHHDGPRPTLCVLHGFGASAHAVNVAAFSLRRFFADGCDVALFTFPFHGPRRVDGRSNGRELFAGGIPIFNEAVMHAVHDIRALLDHLEAQGVPRVGVTGISLGGYAAALLAAVEPRLDFVIPICAPTRLAPFTGAVLPDGRGLGLLSRIAGCPAELLELAPAVTMGLSYPRVVPRDRLLIIAGIGDRISPAEQTLELWRHWDEPELHWFPGAHVLHFGRDRYFGAMRRLLAVDGHRRG
jgi:hypothetical protein